jgi:hypothetical protein
MTKMLDRNKLRDELFILDRVFRSFVHYCKEGVVEQSYLFVVDRRQRKRIQEEVRAEYNP